VEYGNENLYVLEDGVAPKQSPLRAMRKTGVQPKGKNRLSKYELIFKTGDETVKINRK
jgi:hypothetical protein